MLVYKYNNFADIPGYENFSDKIPVFAAQNYADYIKEIKGHNTVWIVSIENDTVFNLLPFTVIKKSIFRKGYFLTGVISFDKENSFEKEKEFLENVIIYIKKNKLCDWIQQGPNWALFNAFPSASKAVRFGTYKINLKDRNENELFKAIQRADRQDINKAIKSEVKIKNGAAYLKDCLKIINDTAKEGNLQTLTFDEVNKLLFYFSENLKIYVSYKDDLPQGSTIFIGNKYCTYAFYSGTKRGPFRGSNSYLYWQAIKDAKNNNSDFFDFVGARINPPPGSKLERIQRFKAHFGSELIQGYLWKMNFSWFKYYTYQFLVRTVLILRGKKLMPDIIDQELKRK